MSARLMETEGNAFGNTLLTNGENPVVVTGTSVNSRFTSHRDFLYLLVQIGRQVYGRDKR